MVIKRIIFTLIGLFLGCAIPFFFSKYYFQTFSSQRDKVLNIDQDKKNTANKISKESLGFLPFWLIDKARSDYSSYITTLIYFNVTIDSDGHILKVNKSGEGDPGWYTLKNGKMDKALENAKNNGVNLSISAFSSNDENINLMLNNPEESGRNLVNDIIPVMETYGFTDLNLDVEKVGEASPSARIQFAKFVKSLKNELSSKNKYTLSIDVPPISLVKTTNLVDPVAIVDYVDKLILMTYDYHFPGSYVTGPVAPLYGAGTVSEFDVQAAVEKAKEIIPTEKIILGVPLYGYEWDSVGNYPRSTVIPGSGTTISSSRAEQELLNCKNECIQYFDPIDKETHMIYKSEPNDSYYHQAFFPDRRSIQEKVKYVEDENLRGLAFWALGYDGETIFEPIAEYLR